MHIYDKWLLFKLYVTELHTQVAVNDYGHYQKISKSFLSVIIINEMPEKSPMNCFDKKAQTSPNDNCELCFEVQKNQVRGPWWMEFAQLSVQILHHDNCENSIL